MLSRPLSQSISLVTGPTSEPLTVSQAKSHPTLRVSSSHDDQVIRDLIVAAREKVEHDADIALVTQTWKQTMDCFPGTYIALRKPPLASVSSVQYYDSAGSLQTLSSAYYSVDTVHKPGVVWLNDSYSWPVTDSRYDAVQITYVAGLAVASVPRAAILAMHMLIGQQYSQTEPTESWRRAYEAYIEQVTYGRYP